MIKKNQAQSLLMCSLDLFEFNGDLVVPSELPGIGPKTSSDGNTESPPHDNHS